MPTAIARFALVLGVSLGGLMPAQSVSAASSRQGALVRVEVIEDGGAARMRGVKTVAWDDTAKLQLEVGGHAHLVAVTPSRRDHGVSLAVDHDRDGTPLADDLRVTSAERRIVLEEGDSRVVVTIVPVTMHLETSEG